MIIGFIVTLVSIGLDQLTKFLVYGSPARSVLGNFLWFNSTLNTGVAFGMFEGMSILFICLSSVASVVFVYLIISKKFLTSKLQKLSIGFILGGTFSNLLDRIIFGGVRDFIYLKFINYAIFNVADMCVVCGVILICITLIISTVKDVKTKKSSEVKEEKHD